MDILEDYVSENELSQENILKYIDAYSLYSYYIGVELELGTKYSSPLRPGDDDPSFALYFSQKNRDVLMFKDHGNGLSGNVFMFIKRFLGVSYRLTYCQINSDFGLGLDGKEMGDFVPATYKRVPVIKEPTVIRITSQPYTKAFKQYWKSLDITKPTLELYYARDTAVIHYNTATTKKQIAPKGLCISYEIYGLYKIYQPFSPRFKFSNNYKVGHVEGAIQLRWNLPFVIISKSTKECMFYREHFNWDSCAGTSENSPISDYFMKRLLESYPIVFIWLDNDAPGIRAQARYLDKYPTLIPIIMDQRLHAKDPTDLYALSKLDNKHEKALAYIRSLINNKLSA